MADARRLGRGALAREQVALKDMAWQRYILAFIITAAIFGTAFYIASRIDSQRIAEIRTTETNISIDILSSETQFELLGNVDCKTLSENPVLSDELNTLASQLQVAEQNLGDNNPEVIQLKQQYTLLEIKDYVTRVYAYTRSTITLIFQRSRHSRRLIK